MRDITMLGNNGRAIEAGASSVEKDFVSSVKTATEVSHSSFEFHVWSDEGINLHVDLNSSPMDWTNRFRSEFCISENVNGNKTESLWQYLSGLRENSTQGKSSFLWNTSSNQMDDCDGQAKSSSSLKLTKVCVAQLDQQNKGQSTVSPEVSYGAPNHFISGVESCAKKILASDATNTPLSKSLCDSVGNSLSGPGILELQHSKPENECSEDAAKNFNGRESSECSQFDDPLKKSSPVSDDQISKTEVCKKRKNRESEIRGSSGTPSTRILRSMMKSTAAMLLPRRSTRLISKVASFFWNNYTLSNKKQGCLSGSNYGPSVYKTDALPLSYKGMLKELSNLMF